MAHVFISYARTDSSFVKELKNRLEQEGLSVWLDTDLLQPGEDWRQEIDNAIKASFALIAVMTPRAYESKYVTYEWAFALGLGIKVIPLMLEQTALHPRLDVIQYLNFTNHWQLPWDKLIAHLNKLQTSYEPTFLANVSNTENIVLIGDLSASQVDKRKKAAKTLGQLRVKEAIPALLESLRTDSSLSVRTEAIEALIKIGDPSVVQHFIRALTQDRNAAVRAAAAKALGEFKVKEAIPMLLDELDWEKKNGVVIQHNAAISLGKIGETEVVPHLLSIIPHRITEPRILAGLIIALGDLKDPRATPELIAFLFDLRPIYLGDKTVRIIDLAAEALEKIGTPEALAAVEQWRKQQENAQG